MSNSYRDLLVWQRAKRFAVEVTRATHMFPKSEIFALGMQLRRAAVSVPSNIAEGQGRLTRGEFRQFLGVARGSVLELATQLAIAYELGYLDDQRWSDLASKTSEVKFLLNRLLRSLPPMRDSHDTSDTSDTSETSAMSQGSRRKGQPC